MPCAVDVANCGHIYFITWTKNVTSLEDGTQGANQPSSTYNSKSPKQSALKESKPKNGEWERVYIHSFDPTLGDLEGYGSQGRVEFGPHNLSQTSFAYLTVRSVMPEDEGTYKCDVTYTTPHAHGKCPSLTYTRVQTLGTYSLLTN